MNIQSLTLKARSLSHLHRFYTDVLGLPVQLSPPEMRVQIGSTHLIFQQDADFGGFYHLASDVPPHQVGEAQAWLEQRAPLLTDLRGRSRFGPGEEWNTTNLYFADPAGNILELIARHDFARTAGGPFGAGSLLHVSELGVVVPDVPAAVRQLGERFGLFPFNGRSDTFTAVGGHGGMLIVVKAGRGWFPVGRPSVPAPFAVEFRSAAGTHFISQDDLPGATAEAPSVTERTGPG